MLSFLAGNSIYAIARYMLSPIRLSVCPLHGLISEKLLIMQLSPLSSPMILSFLVVNFTAKFQREHRERGRQMREG